MLLDAAMNDRHVPGIARCGIPPISQQGLERHDQLALEEFFPKDQHLRMDFFGGPVLYLHDDNGDIHENFSGGETVERGDLPPT